MTSADLTPRYVSDACISRPSGDVSTVNNEVGAGTSAVPPRHDEAGPACATLAPGPGLVGGEGVLGVVSVVVQCRAEGVDGERAGDVRRAGVAQAVQE